METWYYNADGESKGPCSTDEMFALHQDGVIVAETLVWQPNRVEWVAVSATQAIWSQEPRPAIQSVSALPVPVMSALATSEPTPLSQPQAPPRLKPQAPTHTASVAKKPSFFKRLFGGG